MKNSMENEKQNEARGLIAVVEIRSPNPQITTFPESVSDKGKKRPAGTMHRWLAESISLDGEAVAWNVVASRPVGEAAPSFKRGDIVRLSPVSVVMTFDKKEIRI